jgi:glycosyltransferase involved in cell wall biosynthesis
VAFGALAWCSANGVPAVVMSETTEWDESRWLWKEWIKRRILKFCSSGLVGGRPHTEYLVRLGMSLAKISQGYDAVDNGYFAGAVAEARTRAAEIRKRLCLPDNFFLASARFVEKKNLLGLIEAYARYRRLGANSEGGHQAAVPWDLVLLGDGPLRPTIVKFRSGAGLDRCIHLPGFKQFDELPSYYALASAFIHASTTEQWGLVVNEAMSSGLPVLVSNRCGCAQDLVREGVNGFTFDPNDVSELARFMQRISAPEFPLAQFGSQSSSIVANWGPQRFAEGLEQAVTSAMNAPKPCLRALDRLLLRLLSRV